MVQACHSLESKWGNWGSKRGSDLARFMGQGGGRARTWLTSADFLGSKRFPLHFSFVRPEPRSPLGLKQSSLARFTSGLWMPHVHTDLSGKETWWEPLLWFSLLGLWSTPLTELLALRENQSRILKILVQILILLVTLCMTLGKYFTSLIICFFTKRNEGVEFRWSPGVITKAPGL